MTTKLERHSEKVLLEYCTALGVFFKKLKLASESGWPDRTLLYKGRVMFLELKRKGEKPTLLQDYTLRKLRLAGFEARWTDDLEQAKLIILAWRQYVDDSIPGFRD